MLTKHSPLRLVATSLCCALLLAGCATQDNDLGKDSEADGGAVTCEQSGKSYQVGESVALSACTTCVCQQDGTLGLCTGACPPDAAPNTDVAVTCTQNGNTYQVGETVVLSACTTCVCQQDGTVGLCTGLCVPDAAITCTQNGTTYQVGETVVLSACTTCVCQKDGTVGLCTGLCLPDAAVTCTQNGNTYQVGDTVVLSACTTCVCQQDGTLGLCTGACPPDAAPNTDVAVTCTQNGNIYQVGEVIRYSACSSCVCQKDGTIGMCLGDCPPDAATPDAAGTCTLDGKTYPVGARTGSGCVTCACLADGTWGQCTGACPPDAAQPDTAKQDVVAAEAPPANYTCRNDSDCCIVVDTCMEVAYLYSKAPGATGPPTISPGTMCVPCIPPAVQVRCDQGQCVGEKLTDGVDYNSPLRKAHCGPIDLPDAGAMIFTPAYAGTQPTSWGC